MKYNKRKRNGGDSYDKTKKYNISLTEKEFKKMKSVIRKKETSKTIRSRYQIVLDLDETHGKVLTHRQNARWYYVKKKYKLKVKRL